MLDVITLEWLAALATLAVLGGLGAWFTARARARSRAALAATDSQDDTAWHALDSAAVLERLDSRPEGLSAAEAAERLARHGPNQLPEAKPRSALVRFIYQFHNVLIYVLLLAGAVTALLHHWLDAGVIFGVVIVNALIGFIQEGKAENALRAIGRMLSPHALALRDGRRIQVAATNLVPGDLVPLQPGDRVPADLRLLQTKGLTVEEAPLTGESVPVEKGTEVLAPETPLADRRCLAFSGTLVASGSGLGVVVATGSATEIGRISALVAGVQQLTTPLLRQMDQFGRWLTGAILGLAALAFAFGVWLRDYSATEMFMAAVGLAVAAIPEGLPAIMTITLAIGVQRMAARHAIIRRLPAVETLGTVGVICSDKTGTLTRNEMTVRELVTADRQLAVSGVGYTPRGGFVEVRQTAGDTESDSDGSEYPLDTDPTAMAALRAAVLCNDSDLERRGDDWVAIGDPMEAALLTAGIKAGLDPEQESKAWPRTDLIPFDSEHKLMATLHHNHTGDSMIYVKGAPERLLALCKSVRSAAGQAPLDQAAWQAEVDKLAAQGYRVLAVAECPAAPAQTELTFADLAEGMVLNGLLGLIDPPRREAIEAVATCREAGIRVKVITGDHAVTAAAIARQVGLANTDAVLTGADLDNLDEAALQARVQEVDVYARVTPEHKLKLVTALQGTGQVVAMTGDGVNDAPALKRADVGVAMGASGTEVAKEASEMVLTDDNFATIVHAVEEGRTVYDNLRKAILFILPTNGGEALIILGAIAFGFHQLPLTPVQILWVNMVTAVTLALALAFEPTEPDVMRRHPRDPRAAILAGWFLWRIAFVSLILMLGTFGLYLWEIARDVPIEHARTVAVNTLVAFEIFYLFNARYIRAPVLNREGLLGNPYVLLAIGVLIVFQLGFTYLPPVQFLFGTAAIGLDEWLRIIVIASTVLFLVELEKVVVRRLGLGMPGRRSSQAR